MGISHAEHRRIVTKTASYQVRDSDLGVYFNNYGAGGAVTFTLPNTATIQSGWWCRFAAMVTNQNLVIASYGSSDNLATFNDAGADTITFSTSSEICGAGVEVTWDATNSLWMVVLSTEETQTTTIA